jgi:hypothetical protein
MTTPSPSSRPSLPDCPSHFLLDQWTLGELEHAARVDVDTHVGACARCQGRVASRRADEALFVVDVATLRALQAPLVDGGDDRAPLAAPTLAPLAAPSLASSSSSSSSHAAAPPSRWWRRARAPALGGLVAAGLAFAVVQRGPGAGDDAGVDRAAAPTVTGASSSAPSASSSGVRAKGGARTALFVQDARGVRPLLTDADASGDDAGAASRRARVHPGDTLQVAVTSSTDVFVAVVSQDGAGQVSTYVAADDGALVRVAGGRNVPLPRATVLDDVLGPETVAVFLCDAPGVRAASLATLVVAGAPPSGCVVERHRLDKRGAR